MGADIEVQNQCLRNQSSVGSMFQAPFLLVSDNRILINRHIISNSIRSDIICNSKLLKRSLHTF